MTIREFEDEFWLKAKLLLVMNHGYTLKRAQGEVEDYRWKLVPKRAKRWSDLDLIYHVRPSGIVADLIGIKRTSFDFDFLKKFLHGRDYDGVFDC